MAKKSKSKRSHSTASVKSSEVARSVDSQPVVIPRRAMDDDSFNPDYTPIIQDLKRIGTLAGIFFVILIVLSFFM
jgi:hypothetical protein